MDKLIVCCISGSCPLEGRRTGCDWREHYDCLYWLLNQWSVTACSSSKAVRLRYHNTQHVVFEALVSEAAHCVWGWWPEVTEHVYCTVRDVRVQREGEWRECVMTSCGEAEMINEMTDRRRERQMWENWDKSSDWSRWNRLIAAGGGCWWSGASLMDERWDIVGVQHHCASASARDVLIICSDHIRLILHHEPRR